MAYGLVLLLTGCSTLPALQRKFIRKKKHHPPPAVRVTTKDYALSLSPEERYRRHFALWDFWHAEMLEGLGDSRKKTLRAVDEAMAELEALRGLLVPEQGEKMTAHLGRLDQLRRELSKDALSSTAIFRWRSVLEQQQRVIRRELSWKDVQESIHPDAWQPTP